MRNKENDKTRVQFMAFPMCNNSSTHFMEGKKGTLLGNLNLYISNHY